MATLLSSLKLTDSPRVTQPDPVIQRRHKLKAQLAQQRLMAEAQAIGESYVQTRTKKVVDSETGEAKTLHLPKRLKAWWWQDAAGKTLLAVKYGARTLELAKGKRSIEVAEGELLQVFNTLEKAIDAGELDAALLQLSQTASQARKGGQ